MIYLETQLDLPSSLHRQISDECGQPLPAGAPRYSKTMEFYAGQVVPDDSEYSTSKRAKVQPNRFGFTTDFRLQMDMYDCVPWGNYELTVVTNSTNQGNAMERIAWEVENGPDEVGVLHNPNRRQLHTCTSRLACVRLAKRSFCLRHGWQLLYRADNVDLKALGFCRFDFQE